MFVPGRLAHSGFQRKQAARGILSFLHEGHVLADGFDVGFVGQGRFAEVAFPLTRLLRKDVTLALLATQELAGTRHLESFGDGFPCFGFACGSCHGSAEAREEIVFFKMIFGFGGGFWGIFGRFSKDLVSGPRAESQSRRVFGFDLKD